MAASFALLVAAVAYAAPSARDARIETAMENSSGFASGEIDTVATAVAEFEGNHMDVFAGTALVPGGTKIELYATDSADDEIARLRDSVGHQLFDRHVILVHADHSTSDLLGAQGALSEGRAREEGVIASYPSIKENALVVEFQQGRFDELATKFGVSQGGGPGRVDTEAFADLIGVELDDSIPILIGEGWEATTTATE